MSGYFSLDRLLKAGALSAAITLMAVPRIMVGRLDMVASVAVAFMAMTLIAHSAWIWEHSAGMAGMFPERGRCLVGLAVAALLGALLLLIRLVYLDPVYEFALTRGGQDATFVLRYPDTMFGAVALVLWVAGFETMFFLAGVVAFFARLSRRQWVAIAGATGVRLLVTGLQLSQSGTNDATPLFVVGIMVTTALGALIYVRAGLPAAMLFSAIVSARPLTPPPAW